MFQRHSLYGGDDNKPRLLRKCCKSIFWMFCTQQRGKKMTKSNNGSQTFNRAVHIQTIRQYPCEQIHLKRPTSFFGTSSCLLAVGKVIIFTSWVPPSRYIHISRSAYYTLIPSLLAMYKTSKKYFCSIFFTAFTNFLEIIEQKEMIICCKSIFWMFCTQLLS